MVLALDQWVFGLFSNPIPFQAFIVGMIGSFAYYTALRLGYVGGDQRNALLDLFNQKRIVWFCVVGGCIGAVFQLAQLTTFAPIQALVLGITWPTLVGQYVTGARDLKVDKVLSDIAGGTKT